MACVGKLPGEPEKSCQVCGVPLNKLKYDNRAHKEKVCVGGCRREGAGRPLCAILKRSANLNLAPRPGCCWQEQYIAAKAANNAHYYEPEAPTVSRLVKGRRSSK